MSLTTTELLEACGRLCDALPDGQERDDVRAELARLTTTGLSSANEASGDSPSAVLGWVQHLARMAAPDEASTEVLLRRWRAAETALSGAEPGTFGGLVACLAVEYARDAYHVRTDASRSAPPRDHSDRSDPAPLRS